MKWISRSDLEQRILASTKTYPVTLLLGPRQCGKTSIARRIAEKTNGAWFDLEDPECPLRPESAKTILKDRKGLVIIDEVQRQPTLFNLLRVLSDIRPLPVRFLLLGSAAPSMIKTISESLAGRISYIEMGGFSLIEAGASKWNRLWSRGGFPDSFLAASDEKSHRWRMNFIQSFLERDIPQLGIRVPATALRRFWTMLAHFHGQIWNAADLARAMNVKEDTSRHYLDILCGALLMRQLPPWFENTGKRVVKSPKVYFRDTGILHSLLGLRSPAEVMGHPRYGFSWEGFALEEVLRASHAEKEAFFYRTHAGAELDLFILRGGLRYGFEFKFEDAPGMTRSMHTAIEDLSLDKLWIINNGDKSYALSNKIEILPLKNIRNAAKIMGS